MTVAANTLRAYRRSVYAAGDAAGDAAVRIGERAPAMDALLRRHGARAGVFVTAWNPFSRRRPVGWNTRMQQALAMRLRRRPILVGHGGWRTWQEAHLLVPGDPRPVLRMARAFRQRAVVVVRTGQRARLALVPA